MGSDKGFTEKSASVTGPLTGAVARGATWSGISYGLGQGLRFISVIILARLLFPEDFGVVALVSIVTTVLLRVVDVGFNEAIIQRKDVTESHLSTAFWIVLATGIALCGITVLLSPFISTLFNNEQVRPVLSVYSISFIIFSLGAVHASLLRKRLHFFRTSVADLGEAVTYLTVATVLAFSGYGVWSLVFGHLSGNMVLVIMRWIFSRWRPSFHFSWKSLKDLWKFGLNVAGTRAVDVFSEKLDYIMLGKFLSATTLGFYSLALRASNFVLEGLRFITGRVALPAFSLIRDDDERVRRGFLKSVAFVSLIGVPLLVGLALVAPEFVALVFGPKWEAIILPLQILCAAVGIKTFDIVLIPLLMAKNRPDINLKLSVLQIVLLVPTLLYTVRFEAAGVAATVTVVFAVILLVRLFFTARLIKLRLLDYLAALRPALLGSLLMAMVLFAFRYLVTSFFTIPDIGLFAASVALGIAVYFVTQRIFRSRSFDEMMDLTLDMLKRIRNRKTPVTPDVAGISPSAPYQNQLPRDEL